MKLTRYELSTILKRKVLMTDGGMGTEIYKKGFFYNRCYEELNISHSNLIAEIHKSFIEAGADIIETNTFGANRAVLSRYGLEYKTEDFNKSAVKILKEIRKDRDFFIAGSIGPTGLFSAEFSRASEVEMIKIFEEQAGYLISEGVDMIFLETFSSIKEIRLASEAVRNISKGIFISAMITFPEGRETVFGKDIKYVSHCLNKLDIDSSGINCSMGPKRAYDLLLEFIKYSGKIVSIMPNSGYPETIKDKTVYSHDSTLFAEYIQKYIKAGAQIVGGCCGVGPDYIKKTKHYINSGISSEIIKREIGQISLNCKGLKPINLEDRSWLGSMVYNKKPLYSIEILPPKSINIDRTIKTVNRYKEIFNTVNIPDGPRASARMGISAVSAILKKECSIEPISHYSCRDRNILGIQSDLLALHALGIRNILAVTGDPPKLGNYPNATAVFDINSLGLVKIISNLNKGFDISGNSIGGQTSFVIAVGANPSAKDIDKEIIKLEQKIEAGADFIITQPIYKKEKFNRFYERIKYLNTPVMLGISPITSYEAAEYQSSEIPGMEIDDEVMTMLKDAKKEKRVVEAGIEIISDMIMSVIGKTAGIYFMTHNKTGRKVSVEILKKCGLR